MFDASRHESCTNQPWSLGEVQRAVDDEFEVNLRYLEQRAWRNLGDDVLGRTSIYEGGLGVVWVLHYLSHALDRPVSIDLGEVAQEVYEDFDRFEAVTCARLGVENSTASFLVGRSGALNVLQKVAPQDYPVYQAELMQIARSNFKNPAMEVLWGGPGSIIPILNNLERSPNDSELFAVFVEQLEYLKSELCYAEDFDCWFWTQDLYGDLRRLTGAGHGFAGNVYAFLRGQDFLAEPMRAWLLEMTTETLLRTATVEGTLANWPSSLDGADRGRPPYMVQWCHGAPGVLMSVNHIAQGYSAELDELLLKAGETIWRAGPLTKGLGLCHGTDGNGFAFLKLFERTGDQLWLDRARAFAMHALTQRKAAPGVWEGDSLLPLYLLSCVPGTSNVPLWDFI